MVTSLSFIGGIIEKTDLKTKFPNIYSNGAIEISQTEQITGIGILNFCIGSFPEGIF
jgi:hypothetical protein